MKEKIEVDEFKKLILDMFRGFPNWRYFGMVESVIKTNEDRSQLIEHGFLIKEQTSQGEQYSLGPNALPLVSAWKTEQLTEKIERLTWVVVGLSILALAISISGALK